MTYAAGFWAVVLGLASRGMAQSCAADLDHDNRVCVHEIVRLVNQSSSLDARMQALDDAFDGCPSPAPPIVVRGNQSLNAAINNAPPNSTIIVVAATYAAVTLKGFDHGPLRIIADEEGVLAAGAIPGEVTIVGTRTGPAVDLAGQSNITLQGFQLRGGGVGSAFHPTLRIVDSPGVDIRHCKVTDSGSDGILLEATADFTLFNNAIYGNVSSGIQILDARFAQIYNNTIFGNGRSGISIGSSLQPVADVIIRNNITSANQTVGIDLAPTSTAVDSDYNLINDGLRGIPAGVHDIVGDRPEHNPLFAIPERGDFHVARGIAGSVSPAIDTGDPLTPLGFLSELRVRTTESSRLRDTDNVDIGYHYPFAIVATATPNPSPTPTVRVRTSTPTPTRPPPTPTRSVSVTPPTSGKPLGAPCTSSLQCDTLAYCTTSVCCVQPFCGGGERCDVTGFAGVCAPTRGSGEACAKDSDCFGALVCRPGPDSSLRCQAP